MRRKNTGSYGDDDRGRLWFWSVLSCRGRNNITDIIFQGTVVDSVKTSGVAYIVVILVVPGILLGNVREIEKLT